jgi:hypothetical protein
MLGPSTVPNDLLSNGEQGRADLIIEDSVPATDHGVLIFEWPIGKTKPRI